MRISDWSSDVCSSDLHNDLGSVIEMIVMSHCEPTLSRFSILMLNNVVERTSRCFWISHHVPESAVAVLAAKKPAPLELRNDFLRERIEVYGHDTPEGRRVGKEGVST